MSGIRCHNASKMAVFIAVPQCRDILMREFGEAAVPAAIAHRSICLNADIDDVLCRLLENR